MHPLKIIHAFLSSFENVFVPDGGFCTAALIDCNKKSQLKFETVILLNLLYLFVNTFVKDCFEMVCEEANCDPASYQQ